MSYCERIVGNKDKLIPNVVSASQKKGRDLGDLVFRKIFLLACVIIFNNSESYEVKQTLGN